MPRPDQGPDAETRARLDAPPTRLRLRVEGPFLKADLGDGRSLRLDAEGRWGSMRVGTRFFRRRLDGGPCLVSGAPGAEAAPRDLPADSPWHEAARTLARRALAGLPAARAEDLAGLAAGDARARLAAADAWSPERFLAEAGRFAAAYPEAVPILPPDRYRDLVVLPATGCPWGRCAFCAWYRDARFSVLDPAAFEAHLERVAALFGLGAPARDGLFLGSASALSVPDDRLLAHLGRAVARFGPFPRGVSAFLDPDHAPHRTEADWRRLAVAGLTRAVVGLETGDSALRRRLGKADPARLVETVRALRAAGLSAGVSVLAGPGSPADAEAHLRGTAAVVRDLGLGPGDVVYVSPLEGALPEPALAAAAAELEAALRPVTRAKIAPYRMDLYRYFA